MFTPFLPILIIITTLHVSFQLIVELPTYIDSNSFSTRVCIGTPLNNPTLTEQCFPLQIDLTSPFTWINSPESQTQIQLPSFNSSNSQTCSLLNKTHYKYLSQNVQTSPRPSFEAIEFEDNVQFPQFIIKKIKLLLVTKYKNTPKHYPFISGKLGLGFYREEDKSFSFLHHLKHQNIIKDKLFTFEYLNNENGRLRLGVVPKQIIDNYQYFGKCSLSSRTYDKLDEYKLMNITNEYDIHDTYSLPIWGCKTSSIFMSSSDKHMKYQSNSYREVVYFDINNKNLTIVPMEFMMFMETYVFRSAIDKGDCSLYNDEDNGGYYSIKCIIDIEMIKIDYQVLILEFESKWRMKIDFKMKDIFIKETVYNEKHALKRDVYKCKFISYIHQYDWVFGMNILKDFIIVFDMDNQLLGVYNDQYIQYNDISKVEKVKYKTELDDNDVNNNNNIFIKPTSKNILMQILKYIFIIFIILILLLLFRTIRRYYLLFAKKKKSSKTKNDNSDSDNDNKGQLLKNI